VRAAKSQLSSIDVNVHNKTIDAPEQYTIFNVHYPFNYLLLHPIYVFLDFFF